MPRNTCPGTGNICAIPFSAASTFSLTVFPYGVATYSAAFSGVIAWKLRISP